MHAGDLRRPGAPTMRPVLLRWQVPPDAPPHLSVGIDRLRSDASGATLLVATPSEADEHLLERLDDARRGGATLFALHPGSGPLEALAHESLSLPTLGGMGPEQGWATASHVVTALRPDDSRRWHVRARR